MEKSHFSEERSHVVLPGDVVPLPTTAKVRLGPGLRLQDMEATVVKCGVLRKKKPGSMWVDSNQKRPFAVVNEYVIGTVTGRQGENYAVDIGIHRSASLGALAFEGATKRNRPMLNVGDLVYARLTVANKDMEPELVCVETSGKAGPLGLLSGGLLIECSLGLCRNLLQEGCPVLHELGLHVKYEITVGMNGRFWVNAGSVSDTLLVARVVEASELMSKSQVRTLIKQLQRHVT